jgi:MFS transporter, MHS family, proline/betaine transporter
VILVTPFVGALSDHFGRKAALTGLCLASAALPVTLFALMASGSRTEALLGAVILAMVAGGVSAVGAVTTAEQFRGEGRLTGLALGATMATAIFGGLTPYLSQLLIQRTGWAPAPGLMIAFVAVAVLPVLMTMRETAPRYLNEWKPRGTVDVQSRTGIKHS